jgi:uncharacterized membrane protein
MKPLLQSWAMIVFLLLGGTAMSAEPAAEQNSAYQSTLENYQPLKDESLADWQTLNEQAKGGGHAGHNMTSGNAGSSEMDHGNMDHTTMDRGARNQTLKDSGTMNSNTMDHGAMDHSAMSHESKDSVKATTPANLGNAPQSAKEMDHSTHMQNSTPSKTEPVQDHASHQHAMPDYAPGEAEHAQSVGSTHGHAAMNHGGADASMETHEPMETEDSGNAVAPKSTKTNAVKFEIIPNLHAVAVHFPIALTLLAFVFHLLAYDRKGHDNSVMLAAAGHYTLWIAAISAVITVLLGWQAFNSIANHDDAGHAAMLLHRAWAIPTAIVLALLASWDAWKYKGNELISVPMLIVLFLLTQAIAVTAWLGGEVVYRHGIGVLSIPSPNDATHDHTEGGQHGH